MCGRFTLSKTAIEVAAVFGLPEPPPELRPLYNIAPSQKVLSVGLKADRRTRGGALLKWGLVPSWEPDPKQAIKPINARDDSLHKPTFADAFRKRRCLIPADGFYEWANEGGKKVGHHFRLRSGELFAFAGLWESWGDGADRLGTCCIITTSPNELVGRVHNRMPAILAPNGYETWLGNTAGVTREGLTALLRPYPAEVMEVSRVGPSVNSPRNAGPECLMPA